MAAAVEDLRVRSLEGILGEVSRLERRLQRDILGGEAGGSADGAIGCVGCG